MESITKNRQSTQTLLAMIARAYGPDLVPDADAEVTELGHGWFNVAYRVTLRDGRRVVLKIAPPEGVPVMTYEHDMMRNELTAIALVQEHTSVPVPRVDHADTTGTLVAAPWFAMPFVDADNLAVLGEAGGLAPEASAAYGEQLGTLNRQLNALVGGHFGPLRGPGHPTWRDAFLEMIEDVLRDGERAGVDLGWEPDAIRRFVAAEADVLDEVVEPRFVEWDLWSGNVMVRDGRIVSIIDHERALFGDPLMEIGFAGLDLPAFGDPADFVRGYGREPSTDGERRRRRLYTLYLVLVMVVETRYRAYDDPGQARWARDRLGELRAMLGAAD
ncbi:phosphotransferase family protein [Agromyces sp. MMS24-JH15]|uniref:phosphotransferase family protein n=1 Tax=Agromyces sp. MMS24-JH15 TaxID=3243765 RepID=UPI003748A0E5